jgi:anhydro-N-acetylmuramic acid kinase
VGAAHAVIRYAGLMSGTSMDGVDAVLLEIDGGACRVSTSIHRDYAPNLAARLRAAVADPDGVGLDGYGRLDADVGAVFADAALALLAQAGLQAQDLRAIGSHGQTLLHRPQSAPPYTLQVGDPNLIAERTGIDVVADFRRRDIAAGGEAAPLVPAFHAAVFAAPGETRVIANLGGIANITVLAADGAVTGFDTGPGNCLMDLWTQASTGAAFDRDGAFAASGSVDAALLGRLMAEPYLARNPPKSTGRELFNADWLDEAREGLILSAADVQATLCEFTAITLRDAIALHAGGLHGASRPARVLVCGGGARNTRLMARLAAELPDITVQSTVAYGIDPQQVEGAAFAWLAHRYLERKPGNLPAVTGAAGPRVLGALYPGSVIRL